MSIDSGLVLAQRLHILGSYWGFAWMSLHLGLHWNMLCSALIKKNAKPSILLFYVDYFAMMGLFVFLAHYSAMAVRRLGK